MNTKLSLSLGLLLGAFALPVHAQGGSAPGKNVLKAPFKEFFDNQRGNGSAMRKGEKTLALTSAAIELHNDGNATVSLFGSDTINLFGNWRSMGANTVSFTYTGGMLMGAKTKGSGTIQLRGGRLDSISASGTFGGDEFKVSFSAGSSSGGGPGGGSGGETVTFGDVANGSGLLVIQGASDRTINRVEVKLLSTKEANLTLKVKSGGQYKLRGTWKRGLFNAFVLSGLKGDGIFEGSGNLLSKRDHVSQLTLRGQVQGKRFTLNFRER